jgi:hypothetical protein
MNIQKIFDSLEEDEMNSALGIVCAELESQGFDVEIENITVTSKDIFDNKVPSLEEVSEPLNIKLLINGIETQKFSIEFVDYHDIMIRRYRE